jgi:hypothetical protein
MNVLDKDVSKKGPHDALYLMGCELGSKSSPVLIN